MSDVYMRMDNRSFDWMLRALDDVHEQAAATAMNRGLKKSRTWAKRDIAQQANISPQKIISNRLRVKRASKSRLNGALRILTGPIPAIKLGARDTRRKTKSGKRTGSGVRARGGRSWRNAFIETGLGGHEMVLVREGRPRRPLDAIKVPIESIANRVTKEKVLEARDWIVEEIPRLIMVRAQRRASR